jgi:uncharacterized protein (TIGR03503 family)
MNASRALSRAVFLAFLLLTPCARASAREFDVALAFDESGSMVKSDPRGARKQSAKLFLQMCGPKDRAALIGFAGNVRVLSELETLGSTGARDRLLAGVNRIQSSGAYTDIERALRSALDELVRARDSATSETERSRAVLLLTDGTVDLREGAQASAESVRRIRGELVGRFLQEHIQVHCVALTKGADVELLRYLAESTGGLCVRGEKEADLQRLFVRLFEEVAQPQTAPLTDGAALMDSSVREATFLISHRDAEADAVKLVLPDGSTLTRAKSERASNVQWFSSPLFDLVTVATPQPGKWKIEPVAKGAEQDGNRVMVLTDLELALDEFSPTSHGNERQWLLASLKAGGKTVDAPGIVSRLTMMATLTGPSVAADFPLRDDGAHGDGKAKDGLFAAQILTPEKFGSYSVEVIARTPTLERRVVRTLNVVSRWFRIDLEKDVLMPGEPLALKVVVEPSVLDSAGASSATLQATVRRPDGAQRTFAIIPAFENLYAASFSDTDAQGDYSLTVTGAVPDAKGNRIEDTQGPLSFLVRETSATLAALPPATDVTPPVAATPKPSPTPEVKPSPAPAPTPAPEAPAERKPQTLLIGIVAFMAIAILVALVIVLRHVRSKAALPSMAPLRKKATEALEKKPAPPPAAPPKKPEPAPEAPPVPEPVATPEPEPSAEPEPPAPAAVEPEPPAEVEPEAAPAGPKGEDLIPPDESELSPLDFDGILAARDDQLPQNGDVITIVAPEQAEAEAIKVGKETVVETEEAPATPKETPSDNEQDLTTNEQSLLDEIMQEIAGIEGAPSDQEAPSDAASASAPTLLDVPSQQNKKVTEEAPAVTPTIPEEKDERSEEETIDDILKEIKGIMKTPKKN